MKKIKAKKMATGGLMSMPPFIKDEEDKKDMGISPYDVNTPASARKGMPSRMMSPSRTRFNKGGNLDLDGSGDTTMKDVLIGRGVLDKEGNEQRKKERLKQQQQSASALEQRTGIEKARNESPVSYKMRVFREYQPPVTAADREAAIKAGGMLTGISTNVAAAQDDS